MKRWFVRAEETSKRTLSSSSTSTSAVLASAPPSLNVQNRTNSSLSAARSPLIGPEANVTAADAKQAATASTRMKNVSSYDILKNKKFDQYMKEILANDPSMEAKKAFEKANSKISAEWRQLKHSNSDERHALRREAEEENNKPKKHMVDSEEHEKRNKGDALLKRYEEYEHNSL